MKDGKRTLETMSVQIKGGLRIAFLDFGDGEEPLKKKVKEENVIHFVSEKVEAFDKYYTKIDTDELSFTYPIDNQKENEILAFCSEDFTIKAFDKDEEVYPVNLHGQLNYNFCYNEEKK